MLLSTATATSAIVLPRFETRLPLHWGRKMASSGVKDGVNAASSFPRGSSSRVHRFPRIPRSGTSDEGIFLVLGTGDGAGFALVTREKGKGHGGRN